VSARVPLVNYLVLDDGDPHLLALRCDSCGAKFFNRRNACASCGGRGFTATRMANTGRIRTFSIIHRAPKGIPVPFVAAVIDLDNGGRIQANVLNGDVLNPYTFWPGTQVRLATFDAGTDSAGTVAVGFGYEIEKEAHV